MTVIHCDFKARRRIEPPLANPILEALAFSASLNATLYGYAAQHWSAIAALYRAQRPDDRDTPSDTEPAA